MFEWDKRCLFSANIGKNGIDGTTFKANLDYATKKLESLRALRALDASFLGVVDLDISTQVRYVSSALNFDVKTVVVLGIGGSYAGAAAAIHALRPEKIYPPERKIIFLPFIDPETMLPILDDLDPATTLVNCVSKSGKTVETIAQYALFREKFQQVLGNNWQQHFVFTTDPEKGFLRHEAKKYGIRALDIPSSLGGRFSVLSAVGLFPMDLAGIDIAQVVKGARDYLNQDMPLAVKSALAHKMLIDQGRSIRTVMVYNDSLVDMGKWFVQLWAESLGKQRAGKGIGQTPLLFQGSLDQHSLLQLFMEGPDDKVFTMLRVGKTRTDRVLPGDYPNDKDVNDLAGKRISQIFKAMSSATAAALARAGNPIEIIDIPQITPATIGALFAHFEMETALTGAMLDINPFDQPGVEIGKVFAHALMGRQDLQETAEELEAFYTGLIDPEEA